MSFHCPHCATTVERVDDSLVCPGCEFVPRHGAD